SNMQKVEPWLAGQPNIAVLYVNYNEMTPPSNSSLRVINRFRPTSEREQMLCTLIEPCISNPSPDVTGAETERSGSNRGAWSHRHRSAPSQPAWPGLIYAAPPSPPVGLAQLLTNSDNNGRPAGRPGRRDLPSPCAGPFAFVLGIAGPLPGPGRRHAAGRDLHPPVQTTHQRHGVVRPCAVVQGLLDRAYQPRRTLNEGLIDPVSQTGPCRTNTLFFFWLVGPLRSWPSGFAFGWRRLVRNKATPATDETTFGTLAKSSKSQAGGFFC
ncbi:hypothetical protein, partial [Candidatus Amarobacter glycogenicus]|uniref:hypothetical protein n=1 Tax=Candidatus Amarobacter glycogenicus TaxID=3140699 RepID=UPI0031CC7919